MEERKTIFDYLAQVFCMFGIMVTILCIFCLCFGADAKGISTMFALGAEGLTIATLGQYMLVAIVITAVRVVFFTDCIIQNRSLAFRTAGMMISVVVVIVISVWVWDWFPVTMWEPWVMFGLCFGICVLISTLIVAWKEKIENDRMEEALERLKKEGEENSGN